MNSFFDILSSLSKMNLTDIPEPTGTISITESTSFSEPSVERSIMNGTQRIWRFKNGYGASVVQHSGSYGYSQGLWELAVIEFSSDGTWSLTYETPITDDVIGYLSEDNVEKHLRKIKRLEAKQA